MGVFLLSKPEPRKKKSNFIPLSKSERVESDEKKKD
jgi:hypothetical protein